MKRIITILALGLALAGVSFGQKKLSQRCPGSNSNAEVSISKKGDVAITKCTGRTLTIDGSAYAPAPARYVAFLTQSGANAPVATVIENTLGVTVTWNYDGVGSYRADFSSSLPGTHVLTSLPYNYRSQSNGMQHAYMTVSTGSVYLATQEAGKELEPHSVITRFYVLIEVYP